MRAAITRYSFFLFKPRCSHTNACCAHTSRGRGMTGTARGVGGFHPLDRDKGTTIIVYLREYRRRRRRR